MNLDKIKQLRAMTDLGFSLCKEALEATGYDLQQAIVVLREKGVIKASALTHRLAHEGMLIIKHHLHQAVILEINCETDFVAKNLYFQTLCENIANMLLKVKPPLDYEAMLLINMTDDKNISDVIIEATAKLGENIGISFFQIITKQATESFAQYVHTNSKIASLIVVSSTNHTLPNNELLKSLAMQVVASKPTFISRNDVDQQTVAAETLLLSKQMDQAGLATNPKKELILANKLNKFFEEICLIEQLYIKDSSLKVAQVLKSNGLTIAAMF